MAVSCLLSPGLLVLQRQWHHPMLPSVALAVLEVSWLLWTVLCNKKVIGSEDLSTLLLISALFNKIYEGKRKKLTRTPHTPMWQKPKYIPEMVN